MLNERDDEELGALLEAAQPVVKPEVEGRALAAMRTAARSPERKFLAPRRVAVVGAFVVMLLCSAWLITGRRSESALAQVAEAMAQVRSAHFTGVVRSGKEGEYRAIEGWFKGRTKMRMRTEGATDEIRDGKLRVRIRLDATPAVVHYSFLEGREADRAEVEMLAGPNLLQEALTKGGRLTGEAKAVTRDGRAALLLEVVSGAERSRITVDAATYRLLSLERYDGDGNLQVKVNRIEYDKDLPDSVFQPAVPAGAVIEDDKIAPSGDPEARYAAWEAQARAEEKARKEVARFGSMNVGAGASSTVGSPFHHDLIFEVMDRGGMILLYDQGRNTYRVFGKVLVHEGDRTRVVENDEMPAPGPAILTVEEWKAQARIAMEQRTAELEQAKKEEERLKLTQEMLAQWKAKGKELKAEGAVELCTFGGQCWPVGNTNGGCSFENVGKHFANVWYSPRRGEYYIMGKVRIHRAAFDEYTLMGRVRVHRPAFDQTVQDGWLKVPGPAPRPE